ncbi:MAG: M50 family metallopeptidase [Clostridia bacterium]|nr:M50 family metallopeptidase [Clostridia bacterium]
MKKFSFYIEPFAPAGLFLLFFSWEAAARTAVITSVLVHELSHLAAAKMCGGRVQSLRLTAFGISLGFSPPKTYGEEMFVAAAGPAASFAFAALGQARGGEFGAQVCLFSLFLGIMNLIPIASFDGNRIVSAALSLLFGEAAARAVSSALSHAFLFLAWVLAVYVLFYSGVNFALLLFCAYVFVFTVFKVYA